LRKPSFKFWALTLVLPLCNISPATASGIKVLPSKPVITAISPIGSGDQIADFSVNSTLIAVVGTVEAGLANLVTSPALGGSDGFITTLDKNRKLNWNLRLGSSDDDIATAITQDAEGFFWVVGATSKPVETSTVVVDSSVVNLDSVTVDAADSPKNALTRLALWKIGVNGGLSQTFFFDANGIISPTAISLSGSNLKIIGNLTQELVTQQFSITTNLTGVFSGLKLGKVVTPKPIAIQTIKAGSNKITSFISKTTIIDIPSWRAKKPTPVIVKYTSKGKALAANSLPGKVKKVIWQSGIGTVVLVEVNSDNQIHLLSNMA